MKCRSCDKNIDGEDFRKVADWVFCLECFDKLMAKSKEKAITAAKEEPEPLPPEKKQPELEKTGCSVCGIDIEKGFEKKLGIWLFCDKCYGDLVHNTIKPASVKPEDDTTETTSERIFEKRNTNKVNCYGCDRLIFEAGANIHKGNHFCPDCFYSLPEAERNSREAELEVEITYDGTNAQSPDQTASGEAKKLICESCERIIQDNNYKIIDGFNLCLACITTDEKLALKVARVQHKKRLLNLQE